MSTLPEKITWIRNSVLKCHTCGLERSVAGDQKGYSSFLDMHNLCKSPIGSRPASSLTIREAFAGQILASLSSEGSPGDPRMAVRMAEELCAILSETTKPKDAPLTEAVLDEMDKVLARLRV